MVTATNFPASEAELALLGLASALTRCLLCGQHRCSEGSGAGWQLLRAWPKEELQPGQHLHTPIRAGPARLAYRRGGRSPCQASVSGGRGPCYGGWMLMPSPSQHRQANVRGHSIYWNQPGGHLLSQPLCPWPEPMTPAPSFAETGAPSPLPPVKCPGAPPGEGLLAPWAFWPS